MPKEDKKPKEPKQKARVKTKLKQKVSKSKSHNKSEDLSKLTDDYNAFCTRLSELVKALMHQHAAMMALAKAKAQVSQQLAILSKDTILYETAGQTAGSDRPSESVNSYFSIQEAVTNKNIMYADKYKQFVVDYAQEWYTIVTTRVGEGLKKAETMRVELDHYQSKIEKLRQSANSTMAKGKQVDTKAAEKLTRNEDKLIKTKEQNSKFVNDLCLLMEEITERSWRDLHPLLVKCAQFETQVSGDEAKEQAALSNVVAALKKIAEDHGIKSQARLKDLQQLDPHILSTRSKDDSRNLAIENGFAGLALGGTSGANDGSVYGGGSVYSSNDNNSSYFAPGSTAAQGLGGFPVKVQSNTDVFGTSNSGINGANLNMTNVYANAAPAPTLDTMAQAFGGGAASSAGSSHSRTMGTPSYGRMGSNFSNNSNFSNLSGAPAPPPSSAPPPPPPPTPGFGSPAPSPYGVPAPAPMGGNDVFGTANTYPQSSPMPTAGAYGLSQQPTMPGSGFGQQQSPYGQQSPMPTTGYGQQQQTPMGGGFAQQQSPMGGNYAQQQSMYTTPHRTSAQPAYGQNPFG